MPHDYDTLFLSLAARGYTLSLSNWGGAEADARNPWTVSIHAVDSFGRVQLHEGHGPSAYFALLAARSALDAVLTEAEKAPPTRKPKAAIGFGPRSNAASLLQELDL